jgi:hypothetical protein
MMSSLIRVLLPVRRGNEHARHALGRQRTPGDVLGEGFAMEDGNAHDVSFFAFVY